jgi:hypothetical protein
VVTDAPITLGSRGQIFVSLAAVTTYATARKLQPEAARRQLTELLIGAKLQSDGSYRYRKRRVGLDVDITARVAVDGALLIVTSVSVREYNQSGRRYE